MDAKKFFEEARRMCGKQDGCGGCPVRYNNVYCIFSRRPSIHEAEETNRIIQAIEKWSQEHPKKTRLQDFLEKYPNAPLNAIGKPKLTPWYLGYCGDEACYACEKARGKTAAWCWEQVVEDDETD